ncbi:hypothetical protein THAOC_24014, partial [Thalassiosira oceanica]
ARGARPLGQRPSLETSRRGEESRGEQRRADETADKTREEREEEESASARPQDSSVTGLRLHKILPPHFFSLFSLHALPPPLHSTPPASQPPASQPPAFQPPTASHASSPPLGPALALSPHQPSTSPSSARSRQPPTSGPQPLAASALNLPQPSTPLEPG